MKCENINCYIDGSARTGVSALWGEVNEYSFIISFADAYADSEAKDELK